VNSEDKAAVAVMLARIERIDATFIGWSERMDARLELMAEDAYIYHLAARRIHRRNVRFP
jgi:hypothetical protein